MLSARLPLCFILRSDARASYEGARPYPPKRGPVHARSERNAHSKSIRVSFPDSPASDQATLSTPVD